MARRSLRNTISLALALILAFPLATNALAAGWTSGCPSGTGYFVCVYRDADFSGPNGYWSGGNYSYVGQNYPGTTQTINDSVTSLRNKYAAHDVTWWPDINFGGIGLCIDSNSSVSNLWWVPGYNDTLSSHQLMVNDSFC